MTDCALISLEFATAEGLERAAKFVLQAASTFKNRVANPTDEGYRDLLFVVLVDGHLCEVRCAAPPLPDALGQRGIEERVDAGRLPLGAERWGRRWGRRCGRRGGRRGVAGAPRGRRP